MNRSAPYSIRTATTTDAAVVAHHRAAMFRDMHVVEDVAVPALEAASRDHLTRALAAGDYLGWVVEKNGEIVAGGGLVLRRLLPRPGALQGGQEAYVLNVYTEPEHRRRGLARQLMQVILAWCEARHIARITLHASDDGRPLYDSIGFVPTNEMRLESKG
jgi:GNAT superfamily N-acetyltransferase